MSTRKWTDFQLEKAVQTSMSLREVIGKLGLIPAGGNYAQVKKYIELHGLQTSHFTGKGWRKGSNISVIQELSLEQILVVNSNFQSYKLKRRLFKEKLKPQHCEECGWAKCNEAGYSPLELHHINGDPRDNRLENLQVLCPNCHSLKPNHRGKSKKHR